MTMRYRFPDNPILHYPEFLAAIEADEPWQWVAQAKRNGWRRPGYKEGGKWTFHAKSGREAVQPPQWLVEEMESLRIPDGTALDMEWMGRRDVAFLDGRHWFEVFDILYWRGRWLGEEPLSRRLERLGDVMGTAFSKGRPAGIALAPTVRSGFKGVFDAMRTEYLAQRRGTEGMLSEGLVAKRLDGGLMGGVTRALDNPTWYKIKYREG